MSDHWYRAYGLWLRSELALPEFLPAGPVPAPGIRIRFSPEARRQWISSGATEADGDDFVAAPGGGFVMRVAGVGDYWVRDGCEIGVAPAEAADPVSLRLYLAGSAMGMAFHQRGMLVLHGATVQRAGGAAIFVGESGEGKSTLAACLGRAGYTILGDDTMVLWPGIDQGFRVWPGSRMFKLWSDTISALGESVHGLESVGERLDKFFLANAAQARDEPVPLDEIILLEAGPAGEPASLQRLSGLEALRVVTQHTYRPEYVQLLAREAGHFRICSEVAGRVATARLRRPWSLPRLGDIEALLEAHWSVPEDDPRQACLGATDHLTGGDR